MNLYVPFSLELLSTPPPSVCPNSRGVLLVCIILTVLFCTFLCLSLIVCLVLRARTKRQSRRNRRKAQRMPSLSTDKYYCARQKWERRKSATSSIGPPIILNVHQSHLVGLDTDTVESPPPPYVTQEYLPYTVEEA